MYSPHFSITNYASTFSLQLWGVWKTQKPFTSAVKKMIYFCWEFMQKKLCVRHQRGGFIRGGDDILLHLRFLFYLTNCPKLIMSLWNILALKCYIQAKNFKNKFWIFLCASTWRVRVVGYSVLYVLCLLRFSHKSIWCLSDTSIHSQNIILSQFCLYLK